MSRPPAGHAAAERATAGRQRRRSMHTPRRRPAVSPRHLADRAAALDSAGEIFAWQHDPEAVGHHEYTWFDNESSGIPLLPSSRAVTVRLNTRDRRHTGWPPGSGNGRGGLIRSSPARPRATLRVVNPSSVFADPSGRRRRRLRLLGIGAGAVISAALALIIAGLAGGPKAPFISWALPHHAAGTPPGQHPGAAGQQGAGQARSSAPPAGAPSPSAGPQPSPSADRLPSPRPSASSSPSPGTSTPAPTTTPSPANPAGRTPPGHTRTPNPHKSTHGP